jgi:hypothetical protein
MRKVILAPVVFVMLSACALLAWLDCCTWREAWDEADIEWERFWSP